MVFDYAESNGDDDKPLRLREGGVGVLDVVVWGPRGDNTSKHAFSTNATSERFEIVTVQLGGTKK